MKRWFLISIFFISCFCFSQNNYIVTTKDGRRVLLKADYTWEYIDLEASGSNSIVPSSLKKAKDASCDLPNDFAEPKLNAKVQSQLKKGRATISHVKQKVAKDYSCTPEDVNLVSVKEQKEKATYKFCIKGKEVVYKRVGHNIIKKGKYF